MKFAKLFLLIPTFAMVACSKTPAIPSSEEYDDSVISAKDFNDIFQHLKLFREENVIMETVELFCSEGEYFYTTIEASEGKVKIHKLYYRTDVTYYGEFVDENTFNFMTFEDDVWKTESMNMEEATECFIYHASFMPFDFKDTRHLEKYHKYVIDEVCIRDEERRQIVVQDGKFIFKDSKPTSVKFGIRYSKLGDEPHFTANSTFEYGNAQVELPE